ncbi:MAG: hypothetical protein ACHREM_14135, partial [Polyangiales bacterium]
MDRPHIGDLWFNPHTIEVYKIVEHNNEKHRDGSVSDSYFVTWDKGDGTLDGAHVSWHHMVKWGWRKASAYDWGQAAKRAWRVEKRIKA